jgi:hypothetical protein
MRKCTEFGAAKKKIGIVWNHFFNGNLKAVEVERKVVKKVLRLTFAYRSNCYLF